jgi:hypothetical protein
MVPPVKAAAMVTCALVLVACTGIPSPTASASPTPAPTATTTAIPTAIPSVAPPTPTPSASPTAVPPTPTPTGTALPSVTCPAPIDPTHNLVLATLTGNSTVVLRDITNTAAAQTLCTFNEAIAPRFVTASVVSWTEQGSSQGSGGSILRADLGARVQTAVASWSTGGFGSGIFDWSPDGTALTYIGAASPGPTWHLVSGGTDRVLTTLPTVPGRGVSQQDDDFMLAFSPDGQYLALVNTFTTGGSGDTAPMQIRRVSDGSLVYSGSNATMAVWASVPSRLFFRSPDGALSSWVPGNGPGALQPSLRWVRPHASADGRWIAYTIYDSGGLPHVGLYSVQGNSLGPQPAGLRSGALFLNNNLGWYQEEAATECGLGGCSQTTGNAFIYDIAGGTEVASRITGVFDVWPRVTAPPGLG